MNLTNHAILTPSISIAILPLTDHLPCSSFLYSNPAEDSFSDETLIERSAQLKLDMTVVIRDMKWNHRIVHMYNSISQSDSMYHVYNEYMDALPYTYVAVLEYRAIFLMVYKCMIVVHISYTVPLDKLGVVTYTAAHT